MNKCLRLAFSRTLITMTLIKLLLLLNLLPVAWTAEDRAVCGQNRTVYEIPGDVVVSVFVDINYGPYCNISSAKGLYQISTAIYVIHTLNKYDYIPGLSLGLKVLDTCHDEMTVYKQALQAAVDTDCAEYYELGILVPSAYKAILEPLRNYSVLPISTYKEQNLTKPLINVMVHYLSTRFEVVDLVLVNSDFALNQFLDATKEAGICVRSYAGIKELNEMNTDAVIAVIGEKLDIRQWIGKGEKLEGPRKTWVVLPLDRSHVDDLIPPGSYVIKTEPFDFDLLQEYASANNFLKTSGSFIIHSPYLLGIGKAVVELAQAVQDLQKRNCPPGVACVLPRFNPSQRQEVKNSDVYDALRILPKSHSVKYIVAMKSQQDVIDMAVYKLEAAKFRVTPEKRVPKMPRLCLKKYAGNCEECSNFQKKFGARTIGTDTLERGLLKTGSWIPIFLTVVVCGTLACIVIAIFITYRFFAEDVLDGNPALTIVLILGNIFTLQTVLPFCINDEYFGAENLNSRKIFVTTLAFGLLFSVMLSRAFFLAFSTGGIFTAHVNGYLQALMVFFMSGVQIAISTTYFVLSVDDPSIVARSLTFIALLGYDMFLLTTLFVVCFFIAGVQRNYCEGKCFFGTAIGLLIVWAIWVTCFILMVPECRDIVVCSGIISTTYLIIIGILIPRTYYMMTHLARGKEFGQRFGSTDLGPEHRMIARQPRPFYDYIHSAAGGSMTNLQVTSAYPNYYGSSSPNQKYCGRNRSPDCRNPGYNNYGFHSEMREVNNSYIVPRVCIEDAEVMIRPGERSNTDPAYARPKCSRKKRIIMEERDCIETDVYIEGTRSPSRRPHDELYPSRCASPRHAQTEATIREDEEADDATRITRF